MGWGCGSGDRMLTCMNKSQVPSPVPHKLGMLVIPVLRRRQEDWKFRVTVEL